MKRDIFLKYCEDNGIIIDKEIFIDMIEKMVRYPIIGKMMRGYFKDLGEQTVAKLIDAKIVGDEDPLKETMELCKISGYLKDYKVLEDEANRKVVKIEGAMFGEYFRKRGIKKKAADEPLAAYMEGVYQALRGRETKVKEEACIAEGAMYCVFEFRIK